MPTNKNAYLRYKTIDALLATGRSFSKEQILEALSEEHGLRVSGFTLDKDLQELRGSLRAPIVYDPTLKGYYYSDRNFRLFSNDLDEQDAAALEFASEVLNSTNSVDLVLEAQNVLATLYGKLHCKEKKTGKQIIFRPSAPPVKGLEWLGDLYKAIEKENALTIRYYKLQTGEVKTHTISPYILRQYKDLWYVVAWCASRELTLVFALDRIREIAPAHVNWYRDPKFDPEQYFKYSFGITHSHDLKPEIIAFEILKEAFYYLEIKPLHHSQKVVNKTKAGYLIELEVIVSIELAMALLGMGNMVMVHEPPNLREMMKDLSVHVHTSKNLGRSIRFDSEQL